MCTLYLTEHGTKISKNGGLYVVTKPDEEAVNFPAGYIKCIVVLGKVQITYDVVTDMMRDGKNIIYLNKQGKIIGKLCGEYSETSLYLEQLAAYKSAEGHLEIAKKLVTDKLTGQKALLSYYNKRLQNKILRSNIADINELIGEVDQQTNTQSLMGIEGCGARLYYNCFHEIITNENFCLQGRKKHPAPDPINSMLSFGYSLLEKDIRIYLAEYAGLLLSIGFLHETNFRKDSLVYDLMEPFRAAIVDRFVLRCINLREYKEEDFHVVDGHLYFSDSTQKRFITDYEAFAGSYDEDGLRGEIKRYVKEIVKLIRKQADTAEETEMISRSA